MKREMSEWLVKKRNEYVDGFIDESRSTSYSEGEAIGVQKGFQKCYELMSEQQKPRPIDENTPKDELILVFDYKIWEFGYLRDRRIEYRDHCDEVHINEFSHWLPLPTAEGE